MAVPEGVLGLLERSPSHGYELKQAYDALFALAKPVLVGQVYATLARLERDGRVVEAGAEPGKGPDRRRFAITDDGTRFLTEWLERAEEPAPFLQSALSTKVILALATGRDPRSMMDAQRRGHLERMRELSRQKRKAPLDVVLLADQALFHLEADVRWIDLCRERLDGLREEVLARV
jgi:DNA-binding PadR family transcriptional regulator